MLRNNNHSTYLTLDECIPQSFIHIQRQKLQKLRTCQLRPISLDWRVDIIHFDWWWSGGWKVHFPFWQFFLSLPNEFKARVMLVVLSEMKKKTVDKTYCRTNTFPFNRSSYKIFMSFNKGVGRDDLIVSGVVSQKKWNYQNMNPPWNMIKYRFNFSTSILILASDYLSYLRSMKFLRITSSAM